MIKSLFQKTSKTEIPFTSNVIRSRDIDIPEQPIACYNIPR